MDCPGDAKRWAVHTVWPSLLTDDFRKYHLASELLNRNTMVDARTLSRTTLPGHTRAMTRPRLIQRVSGAGACRVILITGQAAQGKSTLAAELARQPGPAGAWMHLDPSDSDPVNFFHLLVHALQVSRPSLDASGFLKNPTIALGTETGSGRITELAGAFLNEITAHAPVRIVMDGLDRLSGNAESLKTHRQDHQHHFPAQLPGSGIPGDAPAEA
jgi:ATP/maltotriose-dependent transcriptional regulator MalT